MWQCVCNPRYEEGIGRRIQVQANPGQKCNFMEKITKTNRAGGMA
jgi:hypothetical protein